jgi:hypothetical protein
MTNVAVPLARWRSAPNDECGMQSMNDEYGVTSVGCGMMNYKC